MGLPLRFAEVALEQLRELPADAHLRRTVWRRIEEAADDPDRHTEPGKYPVRRMLNFVAFDAAGKRWGFTVVVAVTADAFEVRVVRGAQYDDPLSE